MRRVLSLLVSLIGLLALFVLSGCGSGAEGVGRYECTELLSGELPLRVPESALVLDGGGRAGFELDGRDGTASWELSGEALRLTVDGRLYEGTLHEGVIRLAVENDLTMVFVREDLAADYRAALESEQAYRLSLQETWTGDWYGYWTMLAEEGRMDDSWYDCCARILPQPDGWLTLLFWDEDSSKEKPLGYLKLQPQSDETALAADGWFWFQSAQERSLELRLENGCLLCEGEHDANGERFRFSLCLRRWGETWLESEVQPYYYDTWYLPLIRAGEAMPDRIVK